MLQLFELATISKFKKKIVSRETILGNTVDLYMVCLQM